MKISSTIVATIGAVCLALVAQVSAAAVEASRIFDPVEPPQPHWHKPIPVWGDVATAVTTTLTPMGGKPVPGLPSDGQLSWGYGSTLTTLTTTATAVTPVTTPA